MKFRSLLSLLATAILAAACTAEAPVKSPALSVNVTPSISTLEKDGGVLSFDLTAKSAWSAECAQDWVSFSPSSGTAGNFKISVSVGESNGDERTAEIKFHAGLHSKILTIIQNGDTHGLTEDDYLTCAEARELCLKLKPGETTGKRYFVKGIITSITEAFGTQYGNATFFMSDDGTTDNGTFQVYRCYYFDNVKYSNTADQNISEGDKVMIYGILMNYNGTPETSQNNAYLYKLDAGTDPVLSCKTPKLTVAASETSASFAVSGKNLTEGWKVTTDASWITSYTQSGEGEGTIEVAFDANTGEERTATFTVSSAGASNLTLTLTQAEYQENGTAEHPYSVAEALEIINSLDDGATTATDVYVAGIISSISSIDTGNYGNATYNISDDGSDENTITVFRGFYLEGEKFTSEDQLAAGDIVVIKGKLQKYVKDGNMTPEIAAKNQLYSIVRPMSVTDALAVIDGMEDGKTAEEQVYVIGVVTGDAGISTQYGNATFKLTEDGNAESPALTVFRAKSFDNEGFTDEAALKDGDKIILIGQLQRYVKDGNMTPELSKGWLISILP